MPVLLDLRALRLKHTGEIRITDSELIEVIHIPDRDFSHVVITKLPNLKEVYVHGSGPKWLDCQDLPSLTKLVIGSGARWLKVARVPNLRDLDLALCERIGFLSIQKAPQLERIDVARCRLLQSIHGMHAQQQLRLGLPLQLAAAQAVSKRNATLYPAMTYTDIAIVLSNIGRGEDVMKKKFPRQEPDLHTQEITTTYRYRLLEPGERVYTGGTGETYCYAFEIAELDASGSTSLTSIIEAHGIHEPEDAIGEALRWVTMGMRFEGNREPSEHQVLAYLNLLRNAPETETAPWIKTA